MEVLRARRRSVCICGTLRLLQKTATPSLSHNAIACRLFSLDASESQSPPSCSSRDKGVVFEARVERVMCSVDCALVPTQLSMDGGIDHVGRWNLPNMALDVVTQCKNEQKPVGVQHLREFSGALGLHASPSTLAIFFSASGYSIYAQRFFTRTTHPTILCTIDAQERIVEFLLNDRARTLVPELSVGSCFVDHNHELILTYGNTVLGS